jgi:hypothetical protein
LQVWIPPGSWMSGCCEYCQLEVSGTVWPLVPKIQPMWRAWLWSWNVSSVEAMAYWAVGTWNKSVML